MVQSRNTEVQVFAGGLNLRPAPHLINQEQARKLTNINVRSLNLRPFRTSLFMNLVVEPYMFYYLGEFHNFKQWRSNSIWNRVWYWTDSSGSGKMLRDGTILPLGIPPPTTRPSVIEVAPSAGNDGISGNINYVYTYYHIETGAESPPSPPSQNLDIEDSAIRLSDFENKVGYQIRIYRIGGIVTAYSALKTVSGQITEFTDELKYSEIEGIILNTLRAFPPPEGLHLLTEHQGRFFGRVASKLYYSAPGKPDSWFALDFISFDDTITMIAPTANGLLVATATETWVIVGINPNNFAKYLVSDSEGCISHVSVKVMDGTAIWLSANGFIISSGTSVQNISIGKLGLIKGIDPRGAAIYNDMYILSFGATLVPSNELVPGPDGGANTDPTVGGLVPGGTSGDAALPEGAIVIDFSFGEPIFVTIEQPGLGDLGFYANELYAIESSDVVPAYITTEGEVARIVSENGYFNIVANASEQRSLRKMFNGFDLTRLDYISPLFTEGSIGMLKSYEKVRITFQGVLTVTILDDSGAVMQEATITTLRRDSQWIGIPVSNNKCYGIQIKIVGLGVVDSISYTWTPRESQ